jgi:hypothetical protein
VAKIKAESFGRQIACRGEQAAMDLGLIVQAGRPLTYAVDGHSSSFKYGNLTIHFKSAAPRKMKVGSSQCGLVIRALWHIGKGLCDKAMAKRATRYFTRPQIEETLRHYGLLPAWMQEALNWPQLWRVKSLMHPPRLAVAEVVSNNRMPTGLLARLLELGNQSEAGNQDDEGEVEREEPGPS